MKSKWKEYPNLFRGFDIVSNLSRNKYKLEYAGEDHFIPYFGHEVIKYKNCTLIARKIEDMTDEELCILRDPSLGYMVSFACSKGQGWYYSQGNEQMLYLLSIGVYPFDQNDFNNDDLSELDK